MNSHRTLHRRYERPDQWKHQATVILTGLHPRVLKSLTFASPNLPGTIQPAATTTGRSTTNRPPGETPMTLVPTPRPERNRPAARTEKRLFHLVTLSPCHPVTSFYCSTAPLLSRRSRVSLCLPLSPSPHCCVVAAASIRCRSSNFPRHPAPPMRSCHTASRRASMVRGVCGSTPLDASLASCAVA